MSAPNLELLKRQIEQHVNGFNQGLFVTIDTWHVQKHQHAQIDIKRLYEFTNKQLGELCKRTNKFCYGRSFQRNENRLNVITAIEIGESTERLHAHCMVLHQGNTGRSFEQISDFVIKNCEMIFKVRGENAYKIVPYNPEIYWEQYFVKETQKMFYLHNGFMNIDLH